MSSQTLQQKSARIKPGGASQPDSGKSLEVILHDLLLERSCIAETATTFILFPQIKWGYPLSYHESNDAKWSCGQGFVGEAAYIYREERQQNVLALIATILRPSLETPNVVKIATNVGVKITWKLHTHKVEFNEKGFFVTTLLGDLKGTLFSALESDGGVA